jgi:hypothetical protein
MNSWALGHLGACGEDLVELCRVGSLTCDGHCRLLLLVQEGWEAAYAVCSNSSLVCVPPTGLE